MKKLEELGASPAPWKVDDGKWGCDNEIRCEYISDIIVKGEKRTKVVASCNAHFDTYKPDARLIAAAPELYDAAERYVRFHEESCIHGNRTAGEIIADANNAFKDLKAALAKAAGENGGEA